MSALNGVAVLVTRPEQQSLALRRELETHGANVIVFPILRIKPSDSGRDSLVRIAAGTRFDLIIFTSINAVTCGAPLLAAHREVPAAAIGPATARALVEAGFQDVRAPADGFDSEHLLLDPALRNAADSTVLLVKGRLGRELLHTELAARGARVIVAEVYERERISHLPADLAALQTCFDTGVDVITATSAEIALGLLEIASTGLRGAFERVPWVVASKRIEALLRSHGVEAPIIRAQSAGAQDLVSAVIRWRSRESTA